MAYPPFTSDKNSSPDQKGCRAPAQIGTLFKDTHEEIRFTVETVNGLEWVRPCLWHRDAKDKFRPSKAETAFRPDLLGELLNALREARKAVLQ